MTNHSWADTLSSIRIRIRRLTKGPDGTIYEGEEVLPYTWGAEMFPDTDEASKPAPEVPVKPIIDTAIEYLYSGRVNKEYPEGVGKLDKAVEQAKRGATGPLKGIP